MSRTLLLLRILLPLLCAADATLVEVPVYTRATVGQRVQLNCSSSSMTLPIRWQYLEFLMSISDIFIYGILLNGYNERWQIDNNGRNGTYNLVNPSVKQNDTGTYRCIDMDGAGDHVDAFLNVTEPEKDLPKENNSNGLYALFLLIIPIVGLGVAIGVYVYKRRSNTRNKNGNNRSAPRDMPLEPGTAWPLKEPEE